METNQSFSATPVPTGDPAQHAPPGHPLDVAALAAALAGIRADSRRDPENYLLDTVVPSGGE